MKKFVKASSLLFTCIILSIRIISAQEENYAFNHFKILGDRNVVYFRISNLYDDEAEQDQVLELLLSDKLIKDGSIYTFDRSLATCQLEIEPFVSVNYIRSILQSGGYDIDLTSVTNKNPSKPEGIYNSEAYSFFESFNGYKDYDPNKSGSLTAEDHYAKEKEAWVKENPAEYQKAKQKNGTSVIVIRKDFESFTAEKKQRILSQPEVFIIED
jgi:hypothetical protein